DNRDPLWSGGLQPAGRCALAQNANRRSNFDVVRRNGRERWRAQSLAGSQIETGVMPRAAHIGVGDETFAERAAVMRAGRPDGEDILAAANEQHRFAIEVADDFVFQLRCRDSGLEIGAGQLALHSRRNSERLVASVRSLPSIALVIISVSC